MPGAKDKSQKAQKANKKQNVNFDEIQKRNMELLKDRITQLESSDEEDSCKVGKEKIANLFKNYQGTDNDVSRIQQYFDGENLDCLICIRTVKSTDKIWNCGTCYLPFHLLCIQKWANDSMNLKRLWHDNQPSGYYDNQGNYIQKKALKLFWDCPACRHEYLDNEIPRYYYCYCGKEIDPISQDWLIPHSCGMMCQKPLETFCGHKCTILCHPGKCPSCPQTIQKSCNCGKSPIKTIRCSQKFWTCSQKCTKKLSCGVHKCDGICHGDNECPPCNKKSNKRCFCGQNTKEIKCDQIAWNCGKVCGKILSCKIHYCEQKCHGNECGDCPFGTERSCFCGKQKFTVSKCDESLLDSCGDTCLKKLPCGHLCLSRCHKGECNPCKEQVEKKCRCGNSTKIFPCSKELLCETKCNSLKSCKKHSCKSRCCVECAPCSMICGKMLACGRHKCEALCHSGSCYPCNERQRVTCRCGATSITVRCGKVNKYKNPNCKEMCRVPTKCHHETKPHYCHIGNCPNCKQVCDEPLPCGHKCLDTCHDYVKVVLKDKNFIPAGPWDLQQEKIEYKKLPHSSCKTKVPVNCLGGHETILMNCFEAKVTSCGRLCNRKLPCGNHSCQKPCHPVTDISSDLQDENCENCELPCIKKRPNGCTHSCTRSCHDNSKSCRKCIVQIKTKCFCGLSDAFYRCCDVNKRDIDDDTRRSLLEKYLCCGAKCVKVYPCGHPCLNICHPGICQGSENCKKKVKLMCACKTRKMDMTCDKVRVENIKILECNDECIEKKRQIEEENQRKIQKQKQLEEEKNRKELEEYEKKFGPKKYRERKQRYVEEETNNLKMKILIFSAVFLIISLASYFIFGN